MRSLLITALAVFALLVPQMALSQGNPKKSKVKFRPFMLKASELPPAGDKMNFSLKVEGIRDPHLAVHMYLSRDDGLEEIVLQNPSFDSRERATFETTLYAPVAELRYRFELRDDENKLHRSQEFVTRRNCRENITRAEVPDDYGDITPDEKLEIQAKLAALLEQEVTQYDNAIELLEMIQEEVK